MQGFEASRYAGRWYEIMRLDHSFERGMSNVQAEYVLRDNGEVGVVNRGYVDARQEWESVDGRARFVDTPSVGHLKVSFFGPFFGAYVIFELDTENYQYSLVAGPNRNYLWLLARTPAPDPTVIKTLLARAHAAGFDTDALIRVRHDQPPPPGLQ